MLTLVLPISLTRLCAANSVIFEVFLLEYVLKYSGINSVHISVFFLSNYSNNIILMASKIPLAAEDDVLHVEPPQKRQYQDGPNQLNPSAILQAENKLLFDWSSSTPETALEPSWDALLASTMTKGKRNVPEIAPSAFEMLHPGILEQWWNFEQINLDAFQ